MSLDTSHRDDLEQPTVGTPTSRSVPPLRDERSDAAGLNNEYAAAEFDDDYSSADDYRAVSTSSVAALVLGLLSPLAFLDWILGVIPFGAIVFALIGLRQIARQPEMYTGRAPAIIGLVLAAICWIGGLGRLSYIYATEVPEGYERISYALLQPLPGEPEESIAEQAQALDGKKVFVKGYVYPGLRTEGINLFLLVRDQGSCCFGGNPKITDRIQVKLADPKGFTYSSRQFKVAGVFRVAPPVEAVDGPGSVFYFLDDAILR